jgi:hypothetical protein
MEVSNASYLKNDKNKGSQMEHTKKIFKKSLDSVKPSMPNS